MIDFAQMLDGLYIFCGSSSAQSISSVNSAYSASFPSTALWHFRLGHVSSSRFHLIYDFYPYIPSCNKYHVCDICHFARQKCFPYTSSTNIAINPFGILHLDVWGPFHTPTLNHHRYFLTIVNDYSCGIIKTPVLGCLENLHPHIGVFLLASVLAPKVSFSIISMIVNFPFHVM
jgi:hypothetical protein